MGNNIPPKARSRNLSALSPEIHPRDRLRQMYQNEINQLQAYLKGRATPAQVWPHLERLHIIGQGSVVRHFTAHVMMFFFALTFKDWKECLGQLPRLLLAIPGSLFGKYPHGNTGRANVSMFQPMPIPQDIQVALDNLCNFRKKS